MERINVNLVRSCDDSYEIRLGHGILDQLEGIHQAQTDADRFVIVTDSVVNPLYGKQVQSILSSLSVPTDIIEIPAGEPSKCMPVVLDLTRQLMRLNASRKSLLIALGGGVVGDLTGFVASIFMRSIPFVQIATSLVAQVDSSVGGKTGIDLPEGKNLLGTFYQPKAVLIDLAFLETLSDKDFKNGMAEIIKYGIIRDEAMFEKLERDKDAVTNRDPAMMAYLIKRSCEIKADIVEKDEKEMDLRRVLNFGHTLGHALEATSEYQLSHGQAVAIGMAAAAEISYRLDYLDEPTCQRIVRLIGQYGLPTRIPAGFDTRQIVGFLASDKKAVGSRLHFVLVKKIGEPFITARVKGEKIVDIIDQLKL
jgi:3-dehydroquinate synthase